MSITFISNAGLDPAIYWSGLEPSMRRALSARGASVVSPTGNLLQAVTAKGFASVRATRRGDAVFWMQLSARPEWPLAALAATSVGRRRSAYVIDAWPYRLEKIALAARVLRLDPCFVAFREAYDTLVERYPERTFHHLPFGVDEEVFRPGDGDRDIFAMWMGRRHDPLHRALTAYCDERGLRYLAPRGGSIRDPRELGALAGRAKYFVVTPPDLDHPERSGGFSPLVMRYLEGLSAGCRLLGTLPRSGEFEASLPVESILQVRPDGSDLAAALDADGSDTTVWAAVHDATRMVRTSHTWSNRAEVVMQTLAP